ncbi:hypothetical protein [Rickettsia endosymbiont of Polydrusus tereticollis]|uniref:hypothetical protein n=1 Tax=Rickettsia endosymbiont of Polydrusus tereticollis TaxID=3066251 RepID=UPI0031329C4B
MKSDNITTYEQAWQAKPDGRSNEEIYESIVERIRKMYNGKLPEVEAHEAARRLIEFVKILMQVHMRLEEEKNNKA